jgi:hypothetical protein
MDDHFQRPLWPMFNILSKLATVLENDDQCQLLKAYKPYLYLMGGFHPPPLGFFMVNPMIYKDFGIF